MKALFRAAGDELAPVLAHRRKLIDQASSECDKLGEARMDMEQSHTDPDLVRNVMCLPKAVRDVEATINPEVRAREDARRQAERRQVEKKGQQTQHEKIGVPQVTHNKLVPQTFAIDESQIPSEEIMVDADGMHGNSVESKSYTSALNCQDERHGISVENRSRRKQNKPKSQPNGGRWTQDLVNSSACSIDRGAPQLIASVPHVHDDPFGALEAVSGAAPGDVEILMRKLSAQQIRTSTTSGISNVQQFSLHTPRGCNDPDESGSPGEILEILRAMQNQLGSLSQVQSPSEHRPGDKSANKHVVTYVEKATQVEMSRPITDVAVQTLEGTVCRATKSLDTKDRNFGGRSWASGLWSLTRLVVAIFIGFSARGWLPLDWPADLRMPPNQGPESELIQQYQREVRSRDKRVAWAEAELERVEHRLQKAMKASEICSLELGAAVQYGPKHPSQAFKSATQMAVSSISLQQCESLLQSQQAKADRLRDANCMDLQKDVDHLSLAYAELQVEAAKCGPRSTRDSLTYARRQVKALPPPQLNTITHEGRCAVQRPDGSCAEWAF